jgi:membrane-associated phospholipid phosphatase
MCEGEVAAAEERYSAERHDITSTRDPTNLQGGSSELKRAARLAMGAPLRMTVGFGRSRLGIALLGVGGLGVLVTADAIHKVVLPWDKTYRGVLYLMWNATPSALPIVAFIFSALKLAAAVACCGSLGLSLRWRTTTFATSTRRLAATGMVLAVWYLLSAELGRFTSNGLYAVVGQPRWSLTLALAHLESPVIAALQSVAHHGLAPAVLAWWYSLVWLTMLMASVPLCLTTRDAVLPYGIILLIVITACLAMPLFIFTPVFDPWALTLHGAYLPEGIGARLLAPRVDLSALRTLLTETPWSAGAAFPSLHVAFPAGIGMLLSRRGERALGRLYVIVGAITSVVVVVLGRHWIIDIVGGWLFAWIVTAITGGLLPKPLRTQSTGEATVRARSP